METTLGAAAETEVYRRHDRHDVLKVEVFMVYLAASFVPGADMITILTIA